MEEPPHELPQAQELLGVEYEYLPELDSTSDELKRRLAAGRLSRPLLLRCDSQVLGRGTRGRSWQMQPGLDLAMSLALPLEQAGSGPQSPPDPCLPLRIATTLAVAIERLAGQPGLVGLRWPNDLLARSDRRKLGGLLCESSRGWLILGLGLNVNSHPAAGDSGLGEAASLLELGLTRLEPEALGQMLALNIRAELQLASSEWRGRWPDFDMTPGGTYRLRDTDEIWQAEAVDLESGGLWLAGADGRRELVLSYNDLQRLA